MAPCGAADESLARLGPGSCLLRWRDCAVEDLFRRLRALLSAARPEWSYELQHAGLWWGRTSVRRPEYRLAPATSARRRYRAYRRHCDIPNRPRRPPRPQEFS